MDYETYQLQSIAAAERRQSRWAVILILAGFTVFVILLLATVFFFAFANISKMRRAAHEAAVVDWVRAVAEAEDNYNDRVLWDAYGDWSELESKGLLSLSRAERLPGSDDTITRDGYTFRLRTLPAANRQPARYELQADPVPGGARPGTRHFFVDESGLIRESEGRPATRSDPPLYQ